MRGAIPPLPNTPLWRGAEFKRNEYRDNFTLLYLYLALWAHLGEVEGQNEGTAFTRVK
jgi:hypothetical protein